MLGQLNLKFMSKYYLKSNRSINKNMHIKSYVFSFLINFLLLAVIVPLTTNKAMAQKNSVTTLTVSCNVDCDIYIDDVLKGNTFANTPKRIVVSPGSIYVRVVAIENPDKDAGEIVVVKKGENKSRSYEIDLGNSKPKKKVDKTVVSNSNFDFNYLHYFKDFGKFDCPNSADKDVELTNNKYIQRNKSKLNITCDPDFVEMNSNADWITEVEVKYVAGASNFPISLVFSGLNSSAYYFMMTAKGYLRLAQYNGTDWVYLTEWDVVADVKKNVASNVLRAERKGNKLSLYINDNFYKSFNLSEINFVSGSKFGFAVQDFQTVEISNYKLKAMRK